MKTMKLRLLIVMSFLMYGKLSAQENEEWLLNSNSTVISTIETFGEEGHPEINLNYSYDDGPVDPDPQPEAIVLKNYKLYNNGAFNIGYSEGESYSRLLKIDNGSSRFYRRMYLESNLDALMNAQVSGILSVGITYAQLSDKFHVEGSSLLNGATKIGGNYSLEFGPDITKEFNAGKIGYQLFSSSLDIVGAGTSAGDRTIKLWDKVYTPKMIIGTGAEHTGTYAGAILQVNGTIVSKRVVATVNNWPDYVFMSDYQLKSLNEVEDYIEQNGHLPNIPNSETVANDGVDLADMNRLLLEKVEELTLYVISLNNRIKELE